MLLKLFIFALDKYIIICSGYMYKMLKEWFFLLLIHPNSNSGCRKAL